METTMNTAIGTRAYAPVLPSSEAVEGRTVIDYYNTLELILANCRRIGEYRTHFGPIGNQKEDYCFLKNVMIADPLSPMSKEMRAGMDLLHKMIFQDHVDLRQVRSILDIGCGVGGTMKKLAEEVPYARIDGVNLNRTQVDIGRRFLQGCHNTRIIHSDVHQFGVFPKYDLIYMIESAFHIPDKKSLVSKIARLLKPGGSALVIDVYVSERFEKRFRNNECCGLFHYWPISAWTEEFMDHGVHLDGFTDISEPIANYCQVNTPLQDIYDLYSAVVGRPEDLCGDEKQILAQIHNGYGRLSKMLKKGLLSYGILSFRKGGWQ